MQHVGFMAHPLVIQKRYKLAGVGSLYLPFEKEAQPFAAMGRRAIAAARAAKLRARQMAQRLRGRRPPARYGTMAPESAGRGVMLPPDPMAATQVAAPAAGRAGVAQRIRQYFANVAQAGRGMGRAIAGRPVAAPAAAPAVAPPAGRFTPQRATRFGSPEIERLVSQERARLAGVPVSNPEWARALGRPYSPIPSGPAIRLSGLPTTPMRARVSPPSPSTIPPAGRPSMVIGTPTPGSASRMTAAGVEPPRMLSGFPTPFEAQVRAAREFRPLAHLGEAFAPRPSGSYIPGMLASGAPM